MRIDTIRLRAFMGIDSADIELPKRGIVLVTGKNGAGKSSAFIEAAAVGGWGETIRGTPWWREGELSSVEVSTPIVTTLRSRKGAKTKVDIIDSAVDFDTSVKAQEQIAQLLPPFDVWQKTCVFASGIEEETTFTASGDAARKRLLEAAIGIDKFDRALVKCREDIKAASDLLERKKRERESENTRAAYEERRRDEAVARLKTLKLPDKPPEAERKRVVETLAKLKPEKLKLTEQESELSSRRAQALAELKIEKDRKATLSGGKCPTCKQVISKELIAQISHDVMQLNKSAKDLCAKLDDELNIVRALKAEIEEDIGNLDEKRGALAEAAKTYSKLKQLRDELEKTVSAATMTSTKHVADRANISHAIQDAQKRLSTLQAVERVLGLRGVRASILTHTLLGLQNVTNKWLARMGVEQRVELRPFSEKRSGGISDSIGISIVGAGAGYGYDACSRGQQRVIDVGFLLSLTTLSSAVNGSSDSTIFFDEAFDALHEETIPGVTAALEDIAQNRCLVIVSHSNAITRMLPYVKHFHVEDGTIVET